MRKLLVHKFINLFCLVSLTAFCIDTGRSATRYVVIVDLSLSAQAVLQQYQSSIHNLLSSAEMPLDFYDSVVIIGITADSFGNPKQLVRHTIQPPFPSGPELQDCSRFTGGSMQRRACEMKNTTKSNEFKEKVLINHYRDQREHVIRLWDGCEPAATAKITDILGALKYTEQLFATWKGDKRLFIYSDMRHTARGVHLVNRLRNESGLLAELKRRQLIPSLKGVAITVRGVHTRDMSPDDYERLEDFWKRFFDDSGAKLHEFAIDSSS